MGVKTYKCPNCGGDLQLDENFEHGFCMFCGTQLCIEEDNLSVLDVISKINEERAKKLDVLHQASDYEGMFAECQSILSTDANCGIAHAYAGLAVAHGGNRNAELAKECYVMQQTIPNPMNIALPDLNNSYLKLQNSVAVYCSRAIASDDQTAINIVFDLIDEIANDFANGQSKQGVYLPNGMSDCQNAPSLSISTLQEYIAMKLASFLKTVFAQKDKAVNNSQLISQRTKQSSDLLEQVVASPNNARFIPVISAVVMGMKYNYFDTKIDDSMNLSLRESDFNKQLKAPVEDKRRQAASATNAENNSEYDIEDEDDEDDKEKGKASVVVKNNSGKAKKANYFTNFAKHFKQVPMIYICCVMLAVGFITICATKINVAIPIVIVAVAWICMFFYSLRTYKRSVCSACKASLEYGDYSYRLVSTEIKQSGANASRYETYEFTRICPQCGKEKVFTKKLLAATENSETGVYKESNLNLDAQATPGKAFTKTDIIGLNIIGSVVTVIGIVLLIVGIVLGSGTSIVKNPKGEDPKDYYGTYECVGDGTYAAIKFEEDGKCLYISGSSSKKYEYEFVSSEYAYKHLETYKNSSYNDCDLLLVYTNSSDHEHDVMWFALEKDDNNGNYTLYNGSHEYVKISTNVNSKGDDTKDYYGTYECVADGTYAYASIKFEEEGKCYYWSSGSVKEYEYEFVSSEYACKHLNGYKYSSHSDCDALFVYKNSYDHTSDILYYALEKDYYGNYTLYNDNHKYVKTTTDGSLDSVDPQNYYYTYKYDNNNKITFYSNGTCTLVIDGTSEKFEYVYVQQEYVKRYMSEPLSNDSDVIIVWADYNHTDFLAFYVTYKTTYRVTELMLTDDVYFTKA